jgi:hypothetical protein
MAFLIWAAEQCRVSRGIDRAPHGGNVRRDTSRSLVVHDAYGLDRMPRVGSQAFFFHNFAK